MKNKNYKSLIKTYFIRLYLAIIDSDEVYHDYENLTSKEIYYLYYIEHKRRRVSQIENQTIPSELETILFNQFINALGRNVNSSPSLTSGDKVLDNVKPHELKNPCSYDVIERYVANVLPAEVKRIIAVDKWNDDLNFSTEEKRLDGLSGEEIRNEIREKLAKLIEEEESLSPTGDLGGPVKEIKDEIIKNEDKT